jgi:hypothetical protein
MARFQQHSPRSYGTRIAGIVVDWFEEMLEPSRSTAREGGALHRFIEVTRFGKDRARRL